MHVKKEGTITIITEFEKTQKEVPSCKCNIRLREMKKTKNLIHRDLPFCHETMKVLHSHRNLEQT